MHENDITDCNIFNTSLQKQTEVTVPVLMFHHLSDTVKNPWALTTDTFERDLQLLQEQQYEPISMKQLVDFVYQGKALPDKPGQSPAGQACMYYI